MRTTSRTKCTCKRCPDCHPKYKLYDGEVKRIRSFRRKGATGPELAKLFEVTPAHIYNICTYTRRSDVA